MLKSFGRSPDAGPREINWRPFPMSAQADPAWDRCICACCTNSWCRTFYHNQERCICSPQLSEHQRTMAASEIQHKRWSQDVAGENRKECLLDKGRYDAFTIKEDANVIVTSTRISRTRMRNNNSQGFFVHMHGQINTSVICRENRVVCIANGLFFFLLPALPFLRFRA